MFPKDQHVIAPTVVYNYWKGMVQHESHKFSNCQLNCDRSQSIFSTFAEFDLETLRSNLDEKGLAIAESQEMSMKSRKQLSEKTKGTIPQFSIVSPLNRLPLILFYFLIPLSCITFLCRVQAFCDP